MGVICRETMMKERKECTLNFVHWNSAHQRRQNVDIIWKIVDQYVGRRDGSPIDIGENILITPEFQIWKCETSDPIDTDTCSLWSWRAAIPTNPKRLKLLGLMTALTMNGRWSVSDRILCYFRSLFHLTIKFYLHVLHVYHYQRLFFYSGSSYKCASKSCQTMYVQNYSNLYPAFVE